MMGQCEAHGAFEQMLRGSVEALTTKIGEGLKMLSEQSAANGKSLAQVLENQSDRRALCAKQDERIKAQERSSETNSGEHKEFWRAINQLRIYVYMGLGGVVVINGLLALYVKGVFK